MTSACAVGVCSSPAHCREIGRCYSSTPAPIVPGPPAFYIEVVMGGYPDQPDEWRYPRICWHCAGGFSSGGMNSTVAWRKRQLGRYACHRVDRLGVDVPLKPPLVELDLHVADRVLRAFETGHVSNEDVAALRAAVAACTSVTKLGAYANEEHEHRDVTVIRSILGAYALVEEDEVHAALDRIDAALRGSVP